MSSITTIVSSGRSCRGGGDDGQERRARSNRRPAGWREENELAQIKLECNMPARSPARSPLSPAPPHLHGRAEDDVGHLGVDLEVADAAVAVPGDGLDEGGLARPRHAVEEVGPEQASGGHLPVENERKEGSVLNTNAA